MKTKFLIFFILSFFIFSTNVYAHHKPIKVTIVSPNPNDEDFWGIVHNFARASAKDLNINLKITYLKDANHFTYKSSFTSAFKAKEKPDIVIGIFYKTVVYDLLELSNKYDTPIFMFNMVIPKEERNSNYLRKEFKNFIGHMYPDEEYSGYLLGKQLIEIQKNKTKNKEINAVGISGHGSSYVTTLRSLGFKRAAEEEKINLKQIVNANWSADIANFKATKLLDRYPSLNIIWSASDLMAISSKKAILNSNHKQKNEILTGGIDWTKDGILKVKNGELEVSVGGHFSEIGFILVLIHDYFHGKDFYNELGGEIITKMYFLNSKNINKYFDFLTKQDWDKIDFTKYSKVLNPNIDEYNFSFDSLIRNTQ